MGEKRRITRLSRITYMFFFLCRITGCNPAHFGVIRVLSVPSVVMMLLFADCEVVGGFI